MEMLQQDITTTQQLCSNSEYMNTLAYFPLNTNLLLPKLH